MAESTSSEFTLGVEEEYQLVDGETGALRSRARAVLASDWTGEIHEEMQQNTVEVQTRVCGSAAEVRRELGRLRLQAAVAADIEGVRVVAAGTHPFSAWEGHRFTPSPVYERIREEYRRLAESQHIFGLHVHVAIPAGVDRARVLNVVRCYGAWLLALSASSPLFRADDTGYASYRWVLWRRWPRTGPPPRFQDDAEYDRLVRDLVQTGCIDTPGRIYWEIRPHHVYPTIEFRVADVTPRLDDAVALAALARVLVVAAAEGELAEPRLSEALLGTLLVENSWRAARYGLAAELMDLQSGHPEPRPLPDAVRRLLDRLAPLAERLGEAEELLQLEALLRRGEAARRIRERWEEGAPAEVVRWLADETVLGTGLDRRGEQREEG